MKTFGIEHSGRVTKLERQRVERLRQPLAELAIMEDRLQPPLGELMLIRNRRDGINTSAYRHMARFVHRGILPDGVYEGDFRTEAATNLETARDGLCAPSPVSIRQIVSANAMYWQRAYVSPADGPDRIRQYYDQLIAVYKDSRP